MGGKGADIMQTLVAFSTLQSSLLFWVPASSTPPAPCSTYCNAAMGIQDVSFVFLQTILDARVLNMTVR